MVWWQKKNIYSPFLIDVSPLVKYGASTTLTSHSLRREKKKKKGIQELKILSLKLQKWGSSSEHQ